MFLTYVSRNSCSHSSHYNDSNNNVRKRITKYVCYSINTKNNNNEWFWSEIAFISFLHAVLFNDDVRN